MDGWKNKWDAEISLNEVNIWQPGHNGGANKKQKMKVPSWKVGKLGTG